MFHLLTPMMCAARLRRFILFSAILPELPILVEPQSSDSGNSCKILVLPDPNEVEVSVYLDSTSDHGYKNAAYPVAITALKADETLAAETGLRQSKYMNDLRGTRYRSTILWKPHYNSQ